MNHFKTVQEHFIKLSAPVKRPMLSNFFAGLGMYHAIYNEDSTAQVILALFAPSMYIGYHSYKNYGRLNREVSEWSGKKF